MPLENDELNIPELTADFAKTLLGDDGGNGDPAPAPGEPTPAPGPAPVPAPIDPIAQLLAEDPLPKSWKKDHEPLWAKTDKSMRDAIKAREADVSRGIQMYQGGYKQWDAMTKPFEQVMKSNPNFGPEQQVQLFQNLMSSHLRMLSLQGPEKVEFAKNLLKAYGMDVGALTGTSAPPPPPAIPPEFQTRVSAAEAAARRTQETLDQFLLSENQKVVDAFFADPKNEYAAELTPEIGQLLQSGQAKDLPTAYEQAIWLNPSVRAKVQEKAFAERTRLAAEDAKKAQRLANLNRSSSQDGTPPAGKKKTVDETVDEIVAKHLTQH